MVLASLCMTAATAAAQLQEPSDSSADIIVTGERVPRSLRDTASSVSVVTGEEIDAGPPQDRIDQLLANIANVQVTGNAGPTIRGQDTTGAIRDLPGFLGGSRPRTTIVVDGRAVSFNEFLFGSAPLWDVDRVEVFRTPQTTTQGRNSIAGAIFIHSRDPNDDWEGRARALAGDFRTRQLSGTASGPILAEQLAFRLSGDWRRSRMFNRPAGRLEGADPNRDEYGLLRFKLVSEPSAIPRSRIELTYAHTESKVPSAQVRAPFRERRDPSTFVAVFRTNVDSLTGAIDYEPITGLIVRTVATVGDTKVRRFAPPGLGETRTKVRDWSVESVVDWKPDASFRLNGGLSYTHAALDQVIDISQLAGIGEFDDRQRSFGVFGEASWHLAPRAKLTTGLRYQHDQQVRTGALGNSSLLIPLDYDRSFHAWLPKVSLSYDFSEALLAGLLVQRAYNPGGVSLRFDTGLPDEFEAERLWNYELFARASLSPALKVRANVFRMDIRDGQRSRPIFIIAPTGPTVTFADLFNVAKARSHGAELEMDWRVSARFSVQGGVGLLDTKIIDTGDAPGSLLGNEFQRSPGFTAALALDWRPTDQLQFTTQIRHNGGYFSDDANDSALRIAGSTTVDVRASWRTGRFTLFGYARNLFDEFHMSILATPTAGTAGDPREVGIGLDSRF